jgi:Flp pilus assembly protein TadB
MSASIAETINHCFMLAWDEFGDDKSTEFLVQVTADRLGVEPEEVYDALVSCNDDKALTSGKGNSDG